MEHLFEIDYKEGEKIALGEYEQCTFAQCDLEKADLSKFVFSGCTFLECNLSMAKLFQTRLEEVTFVNCKILGTDFENINVLSLKLAFDSCTLDHCLFANLNAKAPVFKNCKMHEVDFSSTDLSKTIFEGTDLSRAIFDQTNLSSADFRSSFNFNIDPEKNILKGAKFSRDSIEGLLGKFEIVID